MTAEVVGDPGQQIQLYSQQLDVLADEFAALKAEALAMGFPHVESGPMVRSSYHADGQRDIVRELAARRSV